MARKPKGAGQTVLITGASGGIGLEFARLFAKDGYALVLTARSAQTLAGHTAALATEFGVKTEAIPCDLAEIGAGAGLVKMLDDRGLTVDVLVNNAGYGLNGLFSDVDLADQLAMMDLNMRALVELTGLLWPRILKAGRGGVLNVASTAAFQPGPLMAVYCATKAFVLSFSEALWEEARGTGVHVSCLCPGPVATGFSKRAGAERSNLFQSGVLSAGYVARVGYAAYRANRRVKITGWKYQLMALGAKFSPRTMVLKIGRRMLSPANVA